MAAPTDRYSTVAIALHWGIAVLVLMQIGLYFAADAVEGPAARTFIDVHKASGLSILVLTLIRLLWRVRHPAPPLPAATPGWQRYLARITQVLFYVVLIALPLGGWAASSAAQRPIDWFGLFNWPLLPLPADRELAGALMQMHENGAKVLYVLLALHVAGALKHQFIDRDSVLRRMLPILPPR
ncbi:MAG TPA: cytochrome b [Brevundimonas sp.]|jgi:cytochrome b561|uniref:cytochrome b n=1 Tax=Brevundimonas sp. TaxID=1871086 RepID=UPI002E136A17|nr:cytochrome b [Brevundimonas sp.]